MTVHVGYDGKKSKTELMFFPSIVTIARWRSESLEIDDGIGNSCSSLVIRKKKVVNLKTKYNNAPETKNIVVDKKGGIFHSLKLFCI